MRRLAVVLLMLASIVWAAPINLVRNGKSRYASVIAPDASLSERHGAEELQSFIEQMSGARLPITAEAQPDMLLVGRSPALDKLKLRRTLQPGERLSLNSDYGVE